MRANPAIICVSVSGYGGKGELTTQGGFDLVLQAFSGLISVTGEPGRTGVTPGVPIADVNAGILATLGTLSAYIHRLRSGEGQWVQTSLIQPYIPPLYLYADPYISTVQFTPRLGSTPPIIAPFTPYTFSTVQL